jgi:hypothetical protein
MKRTLALLALATAWRPPTAPAQPPPVALPTVIVLRPAAEPRPALKYRLVPERSTLVPGNAAIFYHRAILLMIEKWRRPAAQEKGGSGTRNDSVEMQVSGWMSGPIAEVPRDRARQRLEPFQDVLNEVELGATRSHCDWEFDRRQEGISLLIPEIQEMRSLARLVALRARLAILDGKTEEAMHWIEVGLVMGRHVSQGPTVIQALVGVAIDSLMTRGLEDLIQAPGTPSLYWALADRPRPFIDMRYSLEGERYLLEKELPELSELDRGPWSVDRARRFVDDVQRKLFAVASSGTSITVQGVLPDTARRLSIAAMAAKFYPEARRGLIAQGRAEAQVEAMPVVQVAALVTLQEYQRLRDDTYKWMNVPYWQSYNRLDQGNMTSVEEKLANPLLTLFRFLTPALNSARLATVRLDRQLDALQCIEAIRLYAAAHGGKLPASLEAITEAPVPVDPATGKPFDYKVDGDSATLSAPVPPGGPDHPSYAIRYTLKPAR